MNHYIQQKLIAFGATFEGKYMFVNGSSFDASELSDSRARELLIGLETEYVRQHGHMAPWPKAVA